MASREVKRKQQREATRRYRERHPELVEQRRAYGRAWWRKLRMEAATYPPGPACEICGLPFESTPNFDHNHSTGDFRGWLCASCNHGLGKFKDSPDVLRAALRYLLTRGCYGQNTGGNDGHQG